MRVYALLSRLPFPKSYLGKLLLSAFLGTHTPLLALTLYRFLPFSGGTRGRKEEPALKIILGATLFGTAVTFWVTWELLAPISVASKALREYRERGELPELPTGFDDRAGRLLYDVQRTLERLDGLVRSLGELASKDHLTGAYNRRASEERLSKDIARVQRGEDTLVLAALDLDDLKPINDSLGHEAGDACLRHLANVIGRNICQDDWFARWGGDEFVVVLHDDARSSSSAAEAVLERIAEDLNENPAQLPRGSETRLTVSGRVAACGHQRSRSSSRGDQQETPFRGGQGPLPGEDERTKQDRLRRLRRTESPTRIASCRQRDRRR